MEGPSAPSYLTQHLTKAVLGAILAMLLGGVALGKLLAGFFALGSELADMVGVLVFPFCFGGDMPRGAGLFHLVLHPRWVQVGLTACRVPDGSLFTATAFMSIDDVPDLSRRLTRSGVVLAA